MTYIKIGKSGESIEKIGLSPKIKNPRKYRIGAIMWVEVMPHKSYTGNDYKLAVLLSNGAKLEMDDSHTTYTWSEFMEALTIGATGEKPKSGDEEKVTDVFGIPIKVREVTEDLAEDITESTDPLIEVITPLPKKQTPVSTISPAPIPSTTPSANRLPSLEDKSSNETRIKNGYGVY